MRRRAVTREAELWAGFVDGLAALLLVLLFLVLIFALGQSALSARLGETRSGLAAAAAERERLAAALAASETGRMELMALLERERAAQADALARRDRAVAELEAALAGERERSGRLELERDERAGALVAAEARIRELAAGHEELWGKIATLEARLAHSERELRARELAVAELEARVDRLLAERLRELEHYRSEFFGRLREALGERPEIRVVGDRFVIAAEILFPSGSDQLSEQGLAELSRVAEILVELMGTIPAELPWVLQVDGHTDRRPIRSARFPSNWELSTARALAVVRHLIARGLPPERLVAAGFGEHRPLDPGSDEAALARNRRIEFKLTSR